MIRLLTIVVFVAALAGCESGPETRKTVSDLPTLPVVPLEPLAEEDVK